jgi:4-alpha-glucanotransferase
LPTYRWSAIAAADYQWIRVRARRMASLFDGYRVDHLVGLYRTYGRPADGEPFFNPATEEEQTAQGERILGMLQATGAGIIAEDLGLVPDFVRASMARLGVPGCKVQRWERQWREPGEPFIDPMDYPPVSAAMTGTHDTETLAAWWDGASDDDRRALLQLRPVAAAGIVDPEQPFDDRLRDALLRMMYGAASRELLLPMQDVFGWRDRINTPGTVGEDNWTWRLPWPVDELPSVPAAAARAAFLRAL